MAFIATYISSVAGGSELSSYYEEIAEWSSATDILAHELAVKESYDLLNSRLDPYMAVPIQKEFSTARYPAIIRRAQAKAAVAMCVERKHGFATEEASKQWAIFEAELKVIIENRAQFEWAYSPDEVGIGLAIPASTNTSTGQIFVDRSKDFTGDVEQTYTITITTGGAIGTAIWKWADGQGNQTTGLTSSYSWYGLENGVSICFADSGDNFALNDTWTIRCVPLDTPTENPSGLVVTIGLRK